MALAYFDCFAGAGGDMIVAALLDAGADRVRLEQQLSALGLSDYRIRVESVQRSGLGGTKFTIDVNTDHQPHRHLSHILEIIDAAQLPERAAERARRIFTRLAEAEAKVHKTDIEKVHFHEVGAVDSILDVVGACLAMEHLDIETVLCAPIPLGSGTVECDHGTMPVPAPATAELLVGARTVPGLLTGEMTTPTAAAILTTLTSGYAPPPEMEIAATGLGAGTRDDGPIPNLLRVLIGQGNAGETADTVVQLSANLDDCTGEVLAAAIDALLAGGCLDAWASPAVMKKGRPGWVLSALCEPAEISRVERMFLSETTTFGVRQVTGPRRKLARSFETVETRFGELRIKVGRLDGKIISAAPEFEDCRAAAQAHHAGVREVMDAARLAWQERQTP